MTKKLNLSALSVIGILVCCAVVMAQKPVQSSTPAASNTESGTEEETVGNINGSTVNENGQPLPGVVVFIRDVNPGGVGRASTSNSEGIFRANGLGPGLYYVTAFLPGYVTESVDVLSPAAYHRVGETVKLQFVRGGVITGTVTNAAGEPIIGIGVRARMIRTQKGEAPGIPGFSASERTTDDRGVYRLFGLPTGTYLVSAGGASSNQSFMLNPYDSDLPTYAPSSTRDNAAEISVRIGEETNADIRYRGEPGHIVSGSVKLSGPSNATINLTAVGGVVPMANAFQMPGNTGFAFNGIGDGEYDIVAQEAKTISTSVSVPDMLMSEPRRITVKGADVTGLELVTRPLATISGRVTLEPAKVPACAGKRRPLFPETVVTVQRPEKDDKDTLPFLRMISGVGTLDANGNFVLRNLMAGKYLLQPQFYAKYWYLSSITSAAKADAAANWTTLKSGDQLANFTVTLAEGAASVRGRVSPADKTDKPDLPAGLGVYLIPAEREKAADVLRYFVTSVEADGTFAFNNLPPGRYLSLLQPVDAQASTIAKLRLPETAETRTKLRRAAESQKTDIELKACQNLTDYRLAIK